MSREVGSPVDGLVVALSEVPDPVFSQAMVGPGAAVTPRGGRQDALAPVAGTVSTLHPHAFVISTPEGTGILVHLGIDTVKLRGEGFALHVSEGDAVVAGQPVVSWDPGSVEQQGFSAVCPVVVLDVAPEALGDLREGSPVVAGDPLFALEA
ncbi:PTS glucose transporter subunit IIA [Saccharopolyspora sp. HNM0983]|uniref:PTS glucose transporter subunit IIA n=1 Tax=Saccharopolyspora montiporae TaxID=2781240 RepID=A0A929FYH8_9PSEU|nr:PTS glucose transporter subunit IIA [Saccharopolyspora sp. HNM0983]